MTDPQLVATAWTSAGNTSPMRTPGTSPVPIAERIAAIADAGFCGFGLIADDLIAIRDSIGFAGAARTDRRRRAGRTSRSNCSSGGGFRAASPDTPTTCASCCSKRPTCWRRCSSRSARRTVRATSDPLALVAPLRELAEQAAAHGTRVAIETMPFSAIATVPMGAEIIAAAGHPAAGLLVDAWHVFRAGTSLDELRAALRPEMIFGVELDDAAPEVVGTLFEDTVDNRLLCGEGSFDLTGLVAVLRELGFDGPWGVEILSTSFARFR